MDPDPAPLRRAVRAHLAQRPTVSQSPATIARQLAHEHGCTLAEIEDALQLLVGLRHLIRISDPLGGPAKYYQATAEGIIAHETEN